MNARAISAAIVVCTLAAGGAVYLHGSTAQRSPQPPVAAAAAQVPATAAADPGQPAPPPPNAEELGAAAVAVVQAVTARQYDVERVAQALGPGVNGVFAFVRDQIAYEAYAGVLRGADGALSARAANAFDRSLLLARLLAVQGVQTQFASCQLPRDRAETLFARMFASPPTAKPVQGTGAAGARAAAFWARVSTRADHDYQVLKAAAAAVPRSSTSIHEQVIADIQRHAWVQAQVDGRWIDLDASFADSAPGKTYCQAENTADAIPDDSEQRLTIRVSVERLEDGHLQMTPLLEVTRPAVELIDKDIYLVHTRANASGGMGLGFMSAAASAAGWTPALSIDGDVQTGNADTFGDSTSQSGGFDALAGGGSSTSTFVAEWLDFEVAMPDGTKEVARRTLIDRAGAAWRASSDHDPKRLRPIAADASGPVGPQAVYNIWVSGGPHNLARYTRRLLALTYGRAANADDSIDDQLRPMAARDFAALVWSDHMILPGLNDLTQARLYVASPRITIVSLTPDPSDTNALVEAYDLRRDVVRGVARDASAEALVLDRKLRFAAFEGALEHEAAVRDFSASGIDAPDVLSTSMLLTSAGAATVTPSDLQRLSTLTSNPEKRARMSDALRHGNVLVVPKEVFVSGPSGWWEVAPGGDTRAVLDPDLNASVVKPPFRGGLNSAGSGKSIGRPSPSASNAANTPEPTAENYRKVIDDALAEDEKAKKTDGGGDEYITTVKKVAMKVLKWAGVAGIIFEWKVGDAADQLGAVGMASGS